MPLSSAEAPPDPTLFRDVRALLARGRNHLRRRHVLRGGVFGLWGGVIAALVCAALSRAWWPIPVVEPGWVALALPVVGGALGVLAGAARAGLAPREVALLLDRTLDTGELLVTALHLEKAPPSWSRAAVEARLAQRLAERPRLAQALPIRPPRGAWALPLVALVAVAVLLFVPRQDVPVPPSSPTVAEAARLQDRLDKLDQDYDVALPPDLQQGVDDLVRRLAAGDLDEAQARQQIAALQAQIHKLQDDLAHSKAVSDDLDAAAQALSTDPHTSELSQALQRKDLAGAAEAAKKLSDQTAGMSKAEREQAGKALEQAGKRMQSSSNAGVQSAGQAMAGAGQQLQQSGQGAQGQPGAQGQGGKPSANPASASNGQGGDQGRADLQRLSDELKRDQRLGQKLQSDSRELAKSQELNGALEGSKERMGGKGDVQQGQTGNTSSQQGLAQAADYGVGHTWEDQGKSGTPDTVHHDADRQSARRGGQELDDFKKLYAPVRDPNTKTLLTGVDGKVDEKGHIDVLPTRRTGGKEDAQAPLLSVPATYKQAADQALSGERIPAGYRQAVKQYFDSME